MSQHRAPFVRATRVLQHVAAGLATILAVGVVGAVGTRLSAPDPTAGSPATRVFPDEPRAVVAAPSPVPLAPPPAVAVEPEPVVVPRPVVTTPPPPPAVVIVQDPAPPVVEPAAPEPEHVALAPQKPIEPPKPVRTTQHRHRWDTHAQEPRQERETTNTQQPAQLCAVVCVQLGDEQGNGEP